MRKDTGPTEAARRYAAAYAAHYTKKDLREALELYKSLMVAYPNTLEARYSRSQIQNVVNAVVPRQELFEAQVDLALACFDRADQADLGSVPVTPRVPEHVPFEPVPLPG